MARICVLATLLFIFDIIIVWTNDLRCHFCKRHQISNCTTAFRKGRRRTPISQNQSKYVLQASGPFFASPSFRISIRQSFVAVRHSAFTPSYCSISSECALNRSNISLSLEKYISAPIFFFCVFIVKEMWYIELPTLRRYEPWTLLPQNMNL